MQADMQMNKVLKIHVTPDLIQKGSFNSKVFEEITTFSLNKIGWTAKD